MRPQSCPGILKGGGEKNKSSKKGKQGSWFSELKVNRKELAAARTCQPERPRCLIHVTDPETTAKLPKQLAGRACQDARCCFWKRIFCGWASGVRALHLNRRKEVVKGSALTAFLLKQCTLSQCARTLTHARTHAALMHVGVELVFKKNP